MPATVAFVLRVMVISLLAGEGHGPDGPRSERVSNSYASNSDAASNGRCGRDVCGSPMRPIAHHFAVLAATLPTIACRASEAAPAWLEARAQQEARLAAASSTVHIFRFSDQRHASGITFKNRSVDDAGKVYKLVHYDQGSGVCAADVDGDGQP